MYVVMYQHIASTNTRRYTNIKLASIRLPTRSINQPYKMNPEKTVAASGDGASPLLVLVDRG
jgi:hypothetical protein